MSYSLNNLASQCRKMRGAIYLPSYAANSVQAWLHYDATVIWKELGYARSLGLNTIRIFLQYVVYRAFPEQFLRNLQDLMGAAEANELSVILCFYDGCFGHPASIENNGIPVDPTIRFYPWVACPGLENLRPEFYPEGDRYVADVLSVIADQENVFLLEIMNEPFSSSETILNTTGNQGKTVVEARRRIMEFCQHYSELVRKLSPSCGITIGVSDQGKIEYFQDLVDVVSFHEYSDYREGFEWLLMSAVEKAKKIDKPLLLTECGALGQKMSMVAPICKHYGVGWCFTWLMVTGVFTEDAGLFQADGTPRDSEQMAAIRSASVS